jgi:hypothetical protein
MTRKVKSTVLGLDDSVPRLYGLGPTFQEWQATWTEKTNRREEIWRTLERMSPGIAHTRGLAVSGIMSDDVTKASYFKLLDAGLENCELLEYFVGLAVFLRQKKIGRAQDWLRGSGKTCKTLKEFPRRIANMADEIEMVNNHPLLCPSWVRGRNLSDSHKEYSSVWFNRLPVLLRRYAAYLSGHSSDMSKSMTEHSRKNPKTYGSVLDALLDLVIRETGGYRYAHLSKLLTATAAVTGSKKDFSPDALKMRTLRLRKRRVPQKAVSLSRPT